MFLMLCMLSKIETYDYSINIANAIHLPNKYKR